MSTPPTPPSVLITGTSTGIGRTTALRLATHGWRVFAGVRTDADAGSLTAEDPRLIPVILDVADGGSRRAALDRIGGLVGADGLTALVNNAGINLVHPFETTETDRARHLLEVNLIGPGLLAREALPLLRASAAARGRSARVVMVGSIGSTFGLPWEAWYHVSKAGLLSLTESLRLEWGGQGIAVSCVLPGGTKTPFVAKSARDMGTAAASVRPGDPPAYRAAMTALAGASHLVDRFGTEPDAVARRIHRLLERRHPPFTALVGTDARILFGLARWTPACVRHAVFRRLFAA